MNKDMDTILSLEQLAQIIERNPTALAVVANMPRIEIDDVAYACSQMATDMAVARDLVATSSGRLIEDVPGGWLTIIRATIITGLTIEAHSPQSIAGVLLSAVAPGFGNEAGSIQ
ncbi:hypothetical protein [Sphingomonas sp. Leaf230]|uniref:hypothetical protein n=1 Tax=Sphingomonas sp. Leaf230 TaxID=1735694 RepID=UPI0012E2932E|nr:hypothetical protein [Sphingomonas sp. Leaf230]